MSDHEKLPLPRVQKRSLKGMGAAMNCPTCGERMDYVGIDEGAGAFGTAVCDQWHCDNCDSYQDGDCIGDLGYIAEEFDGLEDESDCDA